MGTHQNGEAFLFDDPTTSLYSLISSDPDFYLGEGLVRKWPTTTHIPYLFKILCAEKALPLQVHPDRDLAEELSKRDPENFVDANHKPEIAVVIGEPIDEGVWGEGIAFTGFVGFQPLEAISSHLKSVSEIRQAISNDSVVDNFISKPSKETLKAVYSALLQRSQDDITPHVEALVRRVSSADWASDPTSQEIALLVQKVNAQYPGDVGVISTTFFMNFIKLKRGESVYIGADEVHAYLEGDIIECMAVSDNVLNVAFVPPEERQAKDFIRALTFTARDKDFWRLGHQTYKRSKEGKTQSYEPPLEEFVVLGTSLEAGEKEVLKAINGPSIGIVVKGTMKVSAEQTFTLDAGSIVFVAPNHDIYIESSMGGGEMWWSVASA